MLTFFGLIGVFLLVYAFYMNQTKQWEDNEFKYDTTNLIGSVVLLLYAIMIDNLPFFLLSLVWSYLSLRDVLDDLHEEDKPSFQRRVKKSNKKSK